MFHVILKGEKKFSEKLAFLKTLKTGFFTSKGLLLVAPVFFFHLC